MLPPKTHLFQESGGYSAKKIIILDHFPVGQGPFDVVYMFSSVSTPRKRTGCFFQESWNTTWLEPSILFCVALSCLFRNLLRR